MPKNERRNFSSFSQVGSMESSQPTRSFRQQIKYPPIDRVCCNIRTHKSCPTTVFIDCRFTADAIMEFQNFLHLLQTWLQFALRMFTDYRPPIRPIDQQSTEPRVCIYWGTFQVATDWPRNRGENHPGSPFSFISCAPLNLSEKAGFETGKSANKPAHVGLYSERGAALPRHFGWNGILRHLLVHVVKPTLRVIGVTTLSVFLFLFDAAVTTFRKWAFKRRKTEWG